MASICTVGHGTLGADELVGLLRGAGVEAVADVRRFPGSRRHPHVARESMQRWLADAGIEHRWVPELGGRRRPDPDSPHVALRNAQLRAYADHMASDEFAAGIGVLLGMADRHRVAVMCAESVWWRCHRRFVADHLVVVEGVPVDDLFHDGRLMPHEPTAEARLVDGRIVYDGGTQQALFP
jgi:uncharacterized protein (DUF488 family)